MIDIAKARALCEAAKPGAWTRGRRSKLIIAAGTLLPEALDEITRLRGEIERLRDPAARASTHSEHCWRWRHHHECAIAEVERLRGRVAELEGNP